MWFLIFLAVIFGYCTIAALLVPRMYKSFRGNVPNRYSFQMQNDTAQNLAYVYACLWPIGFFLYYARAGILKVDRKAELDKRERKELEKFRAEAMKELDY